MQTADITARAELEREQRILNERMNLAQLEKQELIANNSNTLQKELQVLRGTQAESIAGIESQYNMLMQSSASAASLFVQTSSGISEILANGDITLEAKQQLVDKQIELLQLGMDIFGSAAGVDFGDLLTVGP